MMVKIDDFDKPIKTTDEDFFKMPPEQWNMNESGGGKRSATKFRDLPILQPVAIILIILLGAATFFLWDELSALKTETKNLSSKVNTADIRSQLTKLEASLNYLSNENAKLKSELVQLKSETEMIQAKLERADAAARKQLPARKSPVSGSQKTR